MPEHGRDGQETQPKYADDLKRRVLSFLEHRHFRHLERGTKRTVSAWSLANALKLGRGRSRETRRRIIRHLIAEARAEGAPIASGGDGYWLATEVDDFEQTEAFLRRMGLGRLASASGIRRSAARSAATGQLTIAAPITHHRMTGGTDFYGGRSVAAEPQQPAVDADGYEIEPPPEGWLFA